MVSMRVGEGEDQEAQDGPNKRNDTMVKLVKLFKTPDMGKF